MVFCFFPIPGWGIWKQRASPVPCSTVQAVLLPPDNRLGLFSVVTQVPSIISLTKAPWGKTEAVCGFNSCMESMAVNHYVVFSGSSFCVLDLLQPKRQLSAGEDWDLGIKRCVIFSFISSTRPYPEQLHWAINVVWLLWKGCARSDYGALVLVNKGCRALIEI